MLHLAASLVKAQLIQSLSTRVWWNSFLKHWEHYFIRIHFNALKAADNDPEVQTNKVTVLK